MHFLRERREDLPRMIVNLLGDNTPSTLTRENPMNTTQLMLLTLTLFMGFSSNALAEEATTKPELKVSEDFWPPQSYMHTVYAMNSMMPILPERRWIGYADGKQVTEIRFHEIAGLYTEVKRLKNRQKRAWTGVVGGAVLAGTGVTLLAMNALREGEPNTSRTLSMAGGGVMGAVGISGYFAGVNALWARGTKRTQAYKVAEDHNKQR